ncbi:hypothetical protein E8E12_009115 [Didymella heteroderae]|uniref:Meiotic expression up-regulated protein 6 PH domain-containing protein n=1 Tax=Didymella heteroderae TaxID=1769908 RepID=A0A9P5C2L9_9PLEO|nr:hypothetical protein E8E12_009115 [Didymella heteroderae]
MSAAAPAPVAAPEAAPAPAEFTPVAVEEVAGEKTIVPATEAPKTEEAPTTEGEAAAVAPVEEKKEDEKVEEKVVEPIYSGALGYKAPGLKNAFRFSKKYFWFGEEAVPASSLAEYLRGEKPEVAHPTAAWSSQTGKGLLFFVKHADKKENPAGVLNLAYATDLVKDGTIAFAVKIHGHKHTFEAQTLTERDGWFVAVEKAIAEAKEAKEDIESSEAYKEEKTKLGKPVALAGATTAAAAPKKSVDATRPAETEAATTAEATGPVRTGSSSSSSSSDAEKKNKKKAAKSKSRSVSRKRASIFGGLLGKKDKTEEPAAEPEVKKEESVAPQIGETSTTAPVITSDIPKTGDELKTEVSPAPVAAETATPAPVETEAAAPVVAPAPVEKDDKTVEKPKPTKRGSIFGSFFEKVKSPSHEKKEADLVPAVEKKEEAAAVPEAVKPVEETPAVAPAAETTTEAPLTEAKLDAPKTEAAKPVTPVKEKEHFSFGKFFGNKEKAKSPAVETPPTLLKTEEAPKVEETPAPVVANGVEPAVPIAETSAAPVEEKKEETPAPKKEKRSSIFGSLARTVSKAGGKKEPKEKKEAPATVQESAEPADKVETPAVAEEKKEETPVVPTQQSTIGDVTPESVNVGEAPKSSAPVATTA